MAGVGLTACEQDTDPKLQKPTEFVLNVPPMADQVYYFSQNAQGKPSNEMVLTVSQPNYGVGVVPTYTVQVARTEDDFKAWDEEQAKADDEPVIDEGGEETDGETPTEGEGEPAAQADDAELPLAVSVDQTFNDATIVVPGDKFCEAVNTLYGFERATYDGKIVPVAVRVHAQVGNAVYSGIWSNPVSLAGVRSYFRLVKGKLYVVGKCTPKEWNVKDEQEGYWIEETEIGSGIYKGKFEVPAGKFQFRFYSELGDPDNGAWDKNSFGAQVEDKPVIIDWNAATGYEGAIVAGKGAFEVSSWAGGVISVVVDMSGPENEWTVTMTPPEAELLYIVGACQGWKIVGNSNYVLRETEEGSGIFEGTVDIKAGDFEFKIYNQEAIDMAKTDEGAAWNMGHYGAQEPDEAVDISNKMTDGVYNGDMVDGKGNWKNPSWAGGKLNIVVDTNTMKVTFTAVTE